MVETTICDAQHALAGDGAEGKTSPGTPKSDAQFGKLAKHFCRLELPLKVLQSHRGFFIGTCDEDGPCSRESVEYFPTPTEAAAALDSGAWTQRTPY